MVEAERLMLVAPVLISVTWLQNQITDTNNWVRPLRYIPSLVFRQRLYCLYCFLLFICSLSPSRPSLPYILSPISIPFMRLSLSHASSFLLRHAKRKGEEGHEERRGNIETNNAKPLCPTNQSCLPCPVCWSVALQFFQSIGNGKQTAGPRRSDWQAGYELGSPVLRGFMADFCTGGWDCLPICTQHSNQ